MFLAASSTLREKKEVEKVIKQSHFVMFFFSSIAALRKFSRRKEKSRKEHEKVSRRFVIKNISVLCRKCDKTVREIQELKNF